MAYIKDQQRNEESLLKVPPLFPLASHWAELESHGHPVSQSGDQGCCDWLSLGQSFNFGRILESFGKLLNCQCQILPPKAQFNWSGWTSGIRIFKKPSGPFDPISLSLSLVQPPALLILQVPIPRSKNILSNLTKGLQQLQLMAKTETNKTTQEHK